MTSLWPFAGMPPLSYDLIFADPPWLFENYSERGEGKNAVVQYDCMPTDEICAMPVNQLARGDAWLWLWATSPMLPDAMRVMSAWGFRYVAFAPWLKRGRTGKLAFGQGYIFRECCELVLVGKIGNPRVHSRSVRNVIEAPRRKHSRKPDEAYETAERLFGPVRRADLFTRQVRDGWDAFGNQTDHFPRFQPGPRPQLTLDLCQEVAA